MLTQSLSIFVRFSFEDNIFPLNHFSDYFLQITVRLPLGIYVIKVFSYWKRFIRWPTYFRSILLILVSLKLVTMFIRTLTFFPIFIFIIFSVTILVITAVKSYLAILFHIPSLSVIDQNLFQASSIFDNYYFHPCIVLL